MNRWQGLGRKLSYPKRETIYQYQLLVLQRVVRQQTLEGKFAMFSLCGDYPAHFVEGKAQERRNRFQAQKANQGQSQSLSCASAGTYKWKGLVTSGMANAGALSKAVCNSQNAPSASAVHSTTVSPPLASSQRGRAISVNRGIHSLQQPTVPRKSLMETKA